MNKLGWEKLGKIIEWFYEQQKQGNQTFEVRVMRDVFNLDIAESNTRLKRFIKLEIVRRISYGCYEINQLSPEKIQEIKEKYIPPGSIFNAYHYKGKKRTVKEIYETEKPPMTLQYFALRIQRGWRVKEALETPINKHQLLD